VRNTTTRPPYTAMALRELPFRMATALCRDARPASRIAHPLSRRHASSEAVDEVESSSFQVPPPSQELANAYDPVARSKLRRRGNKQLPPSRYGSPMA
jgi:large subunit ribosomal protein L5